MFPTDGGKPNAVPVKMSEAQKNKKKIRKKRTQCVSVKTKAKVKTWIVF